MKYIISLLLLLSIPTASFSLSTAQSTKRVSQKAIKLYVYNHCRYCHDVINFLKKNNWQNRVVIVNADTEPNYTELKKLRGDGKDYCPFLVDEIHDKKIADSSKIITYLKKIFTNSDEA